MTNPLSLLAPIASADPVEAPAPVEDPALFAAALVAALQTAMVPMVPVVTTAATATESTADEEPGSGDPGGESDTASPAPANSAAPDSLIVELTTTSAPDSPVTAEVLGAPSGKDARHPLTDSAPVEFPAAVSAGPERPAEPEQDSAPPSARGSVDSQAPTAASSTPREERDAERAGAGSPSRGRSRPVSGEGAQMETPELRPVTAAIGLAVVISPASPPAAPAAGAGFVVSPSAGGASSTKPVESRPGIDRPADRIAIPIASPAEVAVTDTGFVQVLGALQGTRPIPMPAGLPIEPAPEITETSTRALPTPPDFLPAGTSAGEALTLPDAHVLLGEQRRPPHPRGTERMSTDTVDRSASRPSPSGPVSSPAPGPTPAASPPVSAQPAELPPPVGAPSLGEVTERKLPAARQELPAQPIRSHGGRDLPSDEVPVEAKAPSVESTVTSTVPPDLGGGLIRGGSRAGERAVGEARNLPEGKETRDRPAGIADRITLQVDDADGHTTRIRVAVLGDQVRAVIQPHDGEAARHLERRMDELQQALVRQGFVDPKVTVQAAATTGEGAAPWGGAPAAGPTDPPSSRGTDQPPGDHRQGSGRREPGRDGDGHRHSQQQNRERDPQGRRRQGP